MTDAPETRAPDVAPRPAVGVADAARLLRTHFGLDLPVRELGSHQDRNFLVGTEPGTRRVLKIANQQWGFAAVEAQNAALLHLADRGFPVPVPLPATDGSLVVAGDVDGASLPVRLLTFVEGTPLSTAGYLAPVVAADLGRLAGRTVRGLADLEHPGLDRAGQWDLRRASDVVHALLGAVRDDDRRALVRRRADDAAARLAEVSDRLRLQAIHGDLTGDNVVGSRDEAGRLRPDGIIDFGDLGRSWLVAELAVTCTGVLRHRPDAWTVCLEAVRAFHAEVPLDDADVAALWPLVVLRGATLVVAGETQAGLDPDNPSATELLEDEWRLFDATQAVPFDLAEDAVRAALGLAASSRATAASTAAQAAAALLPGVRLDAALDLSSTSPLLDGGHFLSPDVEADVLREAAVAGTAVTRWGEARLTRTAALAADEPATVALGVDVVVPDGTSVHAPYDLTVLDVSAGVVARCGVGTLVLHGIRASVSAGDVVAAGMRIGVTDGVLHMRQSVCDEAPAFARPSERHAWLALCPDPSSMLGVDVVAPDPAVDALLERRDAAFARVQEHYYAQPMRMERGWQHLLVDTDARCYVDMVNNVAAVGHAHPRLVEAVDRQMRLLNTNSRFHYEAVAALSERLAALAPDGLDTVFLVNSGSEAVDLALRIAQVVTGRQDVVAVREAYHGWTYLSDAVTTSLYDNPQALETRPDWVHLASAPNSFRGRYRGPSAGHDYAVELRELVERIASEGRPPAAFICEPLFGNAGGVVLPEGYLGAAYDAVRAVGGLCVADEVQVGYGRTGHHWWAHEMHGVTPDVITIAKAMGNGQPLGAVITTRAIADAFAAQGSFFSSAGGSPVSCVVGLTVLDILRDERLQENAALVGDRLVARFEGLRERFPIIGAVHGLGLYLGVELVRDHDTLEPATAECYAICDRLRELGVVVQPTGERANVLKIKPPMCLTPEAADFVVAQLEHTLTHGW